MRRSPKLFKMAVGLPDCGGACEDTREWPLDFVERQQVVSPEHACAEVSVASEVEQREVRFPPTGSRRSHLETVAAGMLK